MRLGNRTKGEARREGRMIPDTLLDEVSPARSCRLMEDWGQTKTDCDQTDGDDDYYLACVEWAEYVFPPSYRMDGGK